MFLKLFLVAYIKGNTMVCITSSHNQIVKEIRLLKDRHEREEKGLYFVEGVRIVEEALKDDAGIAYTVMTEEFAAGGNGKLAAILEENGLRTYLLPDRLFKEISDTGTPQGILAVMRLDRPDIGRAFLKGGLIVILDSIRDPGNMGAIIRTADAAGFEGVIVSEGCVDVYNPKVLRSTMGSIFHTPVYNARSASEAIIAARSEGFKVFASHLDGGLSIYDADLSAPAALVVGSEAEGVSAGAARLTDCLLKIPMPGRAESLNASVAAGIVMFEAVRQKTAREKRVGL